jgi:hypothetical protein
MLLPPPGSGFTYAKRSKKTTNTAATESEEVMCCQTLQQCFMSIPGHCLLKQTGWYILQRTPEQLRQETTHYAAH